MGTSADGILAYGYDLGGEEEGWKIKGKGIYEYMPASDFEFVEDDDFGYSVGNFLIERDITVHVVSYCSGDYPMYILAADSATVYQGHVKTIVPEEFKDPAEMSNQLNRALDALNIHPTQPAPVWMLASFLG